MNDETNVCKIFGILPQTLIRKLIERLAAFKNDNLEKSSIDVDENIMAVVRNEESQVRASLSLREKLQEQIAQSMKAIEPETQTSNLMSIIKKEMHLFENGGNWGHSLELVYQYLLSIPPTSIKPEQAFSAAGYLGSKIRSRLNDQTLNALLFLRAYFQTKKESL